ncbi:uncharacterized protein LOC127868494 [Dreissena polymorpha]|uniref:Uncharacterized protein n=1 Tax=Dreissena polymorpha TaxID=45954 RepID=A0A9D4M7U3_DREPO|nr:uncharacterized protein LOC127868494 [Dreissena polymorpha]KAH3871413.1 hypothetical protein DPMN_034613 [Dreissena polymorpha]
MKFAVVVLVLLPFALAASVDDKRFIESLLGGYDIIALAKQLLSQFGTDETEAQCEHSFCPELVDKIDGHNHLITTLLCAAVCKEAQVLSAHYLTSAPPIGGK